MAYAGQTLETVLVYKDGQRMRVNEWDLKEWKAKGWSELPSTEATAPSEPTPATAEPPAAPAPVVTSAELDAMNMTQLRDKANALGLTEWDGKSVGAMKKTELVDALVAASQRGKP